MTRLSEYLICSTCRKVFRDAVKVRELSATLGKTYFGCPRCLAEVNVQDSPSKTLVLTATALRQSTLECTHYKDLNKRRISDECLVCSKLLECTKRAS